MSLFAVFGWPLTHSLSPEVHQSFAQQFGIDLSFEKILTPKGHLAQQLADFRARGGLGASITLPLKQEAFALCTAHTLRAQEAMAVNTVFWRGDTLWGDNTDGAGLLRDITVNLGLSLQHKNILILGAGGATLGILPSLLTQQPQNITILNRRLEKAQPLCARSAVIQAFSYADFAHEAYVPVDLMINATSSSLQDIALPLDAHWVKNAVVIDLAYLPAQLTPFQRWALAHGAKQAWDGVGMLIEQAALSFALWHQKIPQTQQLVDKLRCPE
jgi:shikimate dehydrogenase